MKMHSCAVTNICQQHRVQVYYKRNEKLFHISVGADSALKKKRIGDEEGDKGARNIMCHNMFAEKAIKKG